MSAAFMERAFRPVRTGRAASGDITWKTTPESRGFLGTVGGLVVGALLGIFLSLWMVLPAAAQDGEDEAEVSGGVEVAGAVDSFECPVGLRGLTFGAEAIPEASGLATMSDGTLSVTVERTNTGPMLRFFNFQTNMEVSAALVRSAGSIRFDYLNGTTSGRELHAGANYQGLPQDVSDIQFCY
jgi:hypothetical protein